MRNLRQSFLLRFVCVVGVFLITSLFAAEAEAAKRLERTIKQSGIKRDYIVHLPSNLKSRSSWPVIIALHPAFASARNFERITQLHRVRGSENFIVVYPNGLSRSWNVGDCCGSARRRGMDDVGYMRAILKDLATIAPVQQRAYFTGFSNGAMLVYRTMCDAPDIVAAAAPAGAMIRLSSSSCRSGKNIPILHLHGERDRFAPYAGGQSAFRRVGNQPRVDDGVAFFARKNSCGGVTSKVLLSDVTCRNWTGCSGRGDVSLCVVPKLGHLWPGGSSGMLGRTMDLGPARTDVNGSAAIVRFFRNNALK